MCLDKKLKSFVLAYVFFLLSPAQAHAQTEQIDDDENSDGVTELLLSVHINEQDMQHIAQFLQDDDGNLYIHEDDLNRYNLLPPPTYPVVYRGQVYYSAADFAEYAYRLDLQHLSIDFDIPAEFFKTRTLHADTREFVTATKPGYGGFINYDMVGQQDDETTQFGGLFLPGIFTPFGSATSEFLVQESSDNIANENQIVRLNSTWQTDYPETMRTLRLGDSFSTPGLWGNSVDYGGVQWGTNFGTQPAFITFPLPNTRGEAVVPTVIDLYLNNALLNTEAVPPGPFTIDEIPVITGAGTLNVVTTDLLGRQQVIDLPYYATNSLLKPGLHDYSVELGFIRENFGIESNDYGDLMGVVTDRYGINEDLTSEWRVEALGDQQTVGLGGNYLFQQYAVVTLAGAGSHSELGAGGLVEVGFQRQARHGLNYGVNLITTSKDYTQIGFGEDQPGPAFQGQYFAGSSVGPGTLGVTYIQQNNRDEQNLGFVTASYYQQFWHSWALSLNVLTHVKGPSNSGAFLTLSHLFGERTTANLGANAQSNNDSQITGQLHRSLPIGDGWGYNLYTAQGGNENYQASVSAQNAYGTYTAAVAHQNEDTGYQLQARGAVAMIDNDVYLSRLLGRSFGVVEVPGQENVQVYNYHQVVGVTGEDGKVFMPNLLPYQNNPVGVEPNDLPIGVEIQSAETNVIPYYQSGLLVTFPVQSNHGAIVRLVDAAGNDFPAGTTIEAVNKENTMMVADAGEAYLTQLEEGNNMFTVNLHGRECTFSVDFQISDDPLPDLGTMTCKE